MQSSEYDRGWLDGFDEAAKRGNEAITISRRRVFDVATSRAESRRRLGLPIEQAELPCDYRSHGSYIDCERCGVPADGA